MFDDGHVIGNNVNDDTINNDGFVDSISTENIAVADTVEKDVGGNVAAVATIEYTILAADDTIDDWVVGNNSGNDDTSDGDGFGNNFAVDDTSDDKVVGDNATDDANDVKDVGVNVVAFDTVDDEYFSENASSAVVNDEAGVNANFASSFFNIDDDNVGVDIAADNTVRKDDVVDARAGDCTMDDFAVDDVTDGDDTAYKVNNAGAVVINTGGDSTGNDANTADDNYGHKKKNNINNKNWFREVRRLKLRLTYRLSFKLHSSNLTQNRLAPFA